MNANFLGLTSVILSVGAFACSYSQLKDRSVSVRAIALAISGLLAIPSTLFAVHYLHVLPERAWFYTFRSWTGTELLVIFLGIAAGAAATLLPRFLLALPLFALLSLAIVPYIKPFVGPLDDTSFSEQWVGDTCFQSTPSTCGPASVSTILRRLGADPSEKTVARAAFSYVGGTEAWYLARYVRKMGFVPRFQFRKTFTPEDGLPAVVGVRIGGLGHFIPVIAITGERVTFADPMRGEETLPLSEFRRRYQFTGFHMIITRS